MKIGLISDTHGWIHPRLFDHFDAVDEIWHAGDIGNMQIADKLSAFKPLRAVYGNIDDAKLRSEFPESLAFNAEQVRVLLTHVGGTPGNYTQKVNRLISDRSPDIFICGHSHIARVMNDEKHGFLYVNPGAAGYHGFHKFMTAIRFSIEGKRIFDMELIELGERGKAPID